MEDLVGKTDSLADDKLGELIKRLERIGVGFQERLYIPVDVTPVLDKVDISGDLAEEYPQKNDTDTARKSVENVLKCLDTV